MSNFWQMPGQSFVEMHNEQDQEPHPGDELHFLFFFDYFSDVSIS